MFERTWRRNTLALLILPLIALTGCDRSSTEAEHGEPQSLELVQRGTTTVLASTQGTGSTAHWNGGLPLLHPGDELAVNAIFRDGDGDIIDLGGEYTVNAILTSGSPQGVVELHPHGDHVDIEAIGVGTVQIIFQLMHGNHSDWNSPAIQVQVEAQ